MKNSYRRLSSRGYVSISEFVFGAQLILLSAPASGSAVAAPFARTAQITNGRSFIFGADVHGGKIAADGLNLVVGGVGHGLANGGWRSHVLQSEGGNRWTEVALLARNQELGSGHAPIAQSVAIDRAIAVAGTRLDDTHGFTSGAAYVLQESDGRWTEYAKLTAEDGAAGDYFGAAVALDDSRILVGAPGVGGVYGGVGAAYVFNRDTDGQWKQSTKLSPSDGVEGDEFGNAVAILGSTAMVGARLDDEAANNTGSVYVFRDDTADGWSQQTKLYASDSTPGALFGNAISISTSRMLVGAPSARNAEWMNNGGAAYLFEEVEAGNWTQIARFQPDNPLEAGFGNSVSLLGSLAIVGANQNALLNSDRPGAAYVFHDDGTGNWTQIAKLVSDFPVSAEKFGMGVTTNGSSIFVAAQRLLGNNRVFGVVYVYAIPEPASIALVFFGICCAAPASLRRTNRS